MRNLVFIAGIGLAIAGLFILAMGNPLVSLLCLFPILMLTQS